MAGACRRATTIRSSTSQESRSAIQMLQDWTILILEPTNLEEIDAILDSTINTCTTAALNTTILRPPPPWTEDVPRLPQSIPVPLPQEMNEILTNLVNLLQQQNNRLEHMEKNQENILMEVTKQTEEAQWNKHHTTLVTVDDAASIMVNDRKGGKKPPNDSNRGSNNLSLYRSFCGKPLNRHVWKDSPPLKSRWNKEDRSPERR